MNTQLKKLFVSAIIIATTITIHAQTFKLNPKLSNMTIYGTTNVHDYDTKVTQLNAEIVMSSANQAQSLTVTVPVKSIKSKEKLMDTKTYEAFNAETYPTIAFKMTEVNALQINGSEVSVTVSGNLTMNGTTRKITLKPTGKMLKTGTYQFKGALALKMSDFKMKAPTALMGMMKVGDGVTLKYDVVFEGQ